MVKLLLIQLDIFTLENLLARTTNKLEQVYIVAKIENLKRVMREETKDEGTNKQSN